MEPRLSKHKSIKSALYYAANNPDHVEDPMQAQMWLLTSLAIFDIANSGRKDVRGSIARATKAQKILLNRMSGLRRPGTQPAQEAAEEISFIDLTETAEDDEVRI